MSTPYMIGARDLHGRSVHRVTPPGPVGRDYAKDPLVQRYRAGVVSAWARGIELDR